MSLRARIFSIMAGLIWLGLGSVAGAQDYPARPITLVVPFAPGGPTEMLARIVADHMSTTLGRQIMIENHAGSGGTTATTRVMRAPADGYTLEIGHFGTHAAALV